MGYANSDPTNNSKEMKSLHKYDGSYYQHVDWYSDDCKYGGADEQKVVYVVGRIQDIFEVEGSQVAVVHLCTTLCRFVQHGVYR